MTTTPGGTTPRTPMPGTPMPGTPMPGGLAADLYELRTPIGEAALFVPTDWFDLLTDGRDEERAAIRIKELVTLAYAHRPPDVQSSITDTFHAARRLFLDDGMISCGLITLETTDEDDAVTWQICAGVIEVSPLDPDISAGEVLARHFGEQLEGKQVYVESFPTAMGTGFGLVSQPGIHASGGVDTFPELPADGGAPVSSRYAAQLGMAAALSCPVGGGSGLLVVGTCFNPEQVVSLASLVALICGKSTVRRYEEDAGKVTTP
ncbi:hypothetical protein ACWGH2_20895 [Streptomyces sp. NPDC054871]